VIMRYPIQQKVLIVVALIAVFYLTYYLYKRDQNVLSELAVLKGKVADRGVKPMEEKKCPVCSTKECPVCSTKECPVCKSSADVDGGPPGSDGQVHMDTTFGKALYKMALRPDVNNIYELGTWYGGGSTKCLATGLKEKGKGELYTLEIYEPAWNYARKKYAEEFPMVKFLLGCSVSADGYIPKSDIPQKYLDEHFRLYYDRDIELSKRCVPMLKPICLAVHFEMILIDDNEYTGWAEFLIVQDYCKPKYLALHDTGTLKTMKVQEHLATAEGKAKWKLINSGSDAANWEIYENLNYVKSK